MAKPTTLSTGGISVDTREFRDFAKALRKASAENSRSLRRNLRAAGELMGAEARRNAAAIPGKNRTDRIASSIKVRTRGASVVVIAGGAQAPEAGLLEAGNRGQRGGRTFRHPIFGDREAWVAQRMYPFLAPAMDKKGAVAAEMALRSIDDAIEVAVTAYRE